jgi:integrase
MGRPVKDIKHKLDRASGRYMVGFAESPGMYHMTPESDRGRALEWAKRNKTRLLSKPDTKLLIRNLAPGFFDATAPWYQDKLKKGRPMTDASLSIRQGHIVNYIVPLFGDWDARELKGSDIDRTILDAMRFTARRGRKTPVSIKPLSKGTRSKLLYSVKLMYDRWVYQGIVAENPCAGIVKYSKEPERKRSALSRDVLAKLFPPSHGELVRVWGSSMWAALMCVLNDTGARPGEVRALKWGAYYPAERYLPIRYGVESGTAEKIKGTKTDVIRAGYLQMRTVQELAIWRAESRHAADDEFMFTATDGPPVSGAAVGDAFERALKRLGYDAEGWTPYWLRHSFVTYALETLNDQEVLMLAGHSNIITNAIYRHPDDATILRRSVSIRDKMEAARGGATQVSEDQ